MKKHVILLLSLLFLNMQALASSLCLAVFNIRSVAHKERGPYIKAQEINRSNLYGTMIEVGGDSKTFDFLKDSRGGLSNTLVKFEVPHDKKYNREKYPTDQADPRLIKEDKIKSMLSVEMHDLFEKMGENLNSKRPFVFANTAETHTEIANSKQKGYAWVGLRMKFEDGYYEFHLHTTLHREGSLQQIDLGKVGINLIHSAMNVSKSPVEHIEKILESLTHSIQKPSERVKINSFKLFKVIDNGGKHEALSENLASPIRVANILFKLNLARSLFLLPRADAAVRMQFVDPATLFYGKTLEVTDRIQSPMDVEIFKERLANNPQRIGIAVLPLAEATPNLLQALNQNNIVVMLSSTNDSMQILFNNKQEYLAKMKTTVHFSE